MKEVQYSSELIMSALLADINATCASLGYNDGIVYQLDADALQGLKVIFFVDTHTRTHLEHFRNSGPFLWIYCSVIIFTEKI